MNSRTGLTVSLPSWVAPRIGARAPPAHPAARPRSISWRPRRGALAGVGDVILALAVWAAAWTFLALGVLAPAGRL